MLRRTFLAFALLGLTLFSHFATLASAATIMKIGMGDPLNSDSGAYCLKFKELVEAKTNGEVVIELFPNCSLGDETEMLQNTRRGTLDMTSIGIGNTIPFAPGLGILTLPYLFENTDMVVRGTTGATFDKLNEFATKQGAFRIIGFSYADYRHLTNSVRPVTNLEELKGLKIRVPNNRIFLATYQALGANPVPLSWAETFTALQQGVVDGQDNPYIVNHSMKFEEVQKYLTEIHYQYSLLPLIIGERAFQKLTPELQTILMESGMEAQEYILGWQQDNALLARKAMEEKGLQVSTLTDEEKWREITISKVWPEFYEMLGGKAFVEDFLATLKGQ